MSSSSTAAAPGGPSSSSSSSSASMCAARECSASAQQQCGRCRVVKYCGRSCQKTHWKTHRDECTSWTELAENGFDLNDPEDAMKVHNREFRRVIYRHGLDKGDRAERLADFLTDAEAQDTITAQELSQHFEIPQDDASTFLAWINVGLRFKETNMDPQSDNKPDLVK